MARKACFFIDPASEFLNNKIFISPVIGDKMKSDAYPFIRLKADLEKIGIDLSTQDINSPRESDFVFCLDQPQHFSGIEKKSHQIWCLVISEPVIYCPESWKQSNHTSFDYVFTYNKELVDNKKYFHYTFAIDTEYFTFPEPVTKKLFEERKLCTFVSSAMQGMPDKVNTNSLLYQRYQTIKWFGENHPADFEFYGSSFKKKDFHWSFRGITFVKKVVPRKIFHSISAIRQRKLRRVYKGMIGSLDKFKTIKRYNFYLCYENIANVNGYMTEKIFDCFYSSCVPVYWGAPDVEELIPYKCYIDGRKFQDMASLHRYIKDMPFDTYQEYLQQAQLFLKSKSLEKFTVASFSKSLIEPLKIDK